MQLAVIGLNHNTASVSIRERLAVGGDDLESFYRQILANDRIYEAMIISTCNRVEYYIVTDDFLCNVESVIGIIAAEKGMDHAELRQYSYIHCGDDAIRHIFRVASGLDSLVLGEPQIFGQVKDSFVAAREHDGLGTYLSRLEEHTIKTTKKIRTHTGIAENPVSVSYAAVELARKIYGTLGDRTALIIGAGEMCELAARHLVGAEIKHIFVTNRTFARAENLANEIGGTPVPFDSFASKLNEVDIVISSTGAPDYVVTKEMVKSATSHRKHSPMFFIDIAVPRDIDPEASSLENVYVYDMDDLSAVVDANRKLRQKEAVKAEEYVASAVVSFNEWMESMKIVPLIKSLRESFDQKRELELARFCDKFKVTDPEEQAKLSYLLTAYMNKVLHTPLANMKNHGTKKEKHTLHEAVKVLFDI